MTQQQYIINRKLSIIDLGKTLGNISDACRKLGVSRQHYYDIKKAIEEEGLDGLLAKSRQVPRIGNRVPLEIEQKLLDYSLQYPTHGQVRTSNELKRQGIILSAGGVRSIWLRHNLERKSHRLKRLEAWAAENTNVLTESQVKALEEAKEEKEVYGEVESPHPAFLFAQDTCYIGTIKGVGRIYQQTAIDTHSNIGFAKLYTERTALTAADFLNDKVLPFFDEHSLRVLRVLTDNGMEYCGRPESHPYELYLQLNEMSILVSEYAARKLTAQSNGSIKRSRTSFTQSHFERSSIVLSRRSNRILMSSWITTTISGLTRNDIAKAALRCRHSRMARNYTGNMFMMRWTT